MKRHLLVKLIGAALLGPTANIAFAQDIDVPHGTPGAPTHKSSVNAAEAATDPSAVLTQLGFQYWSTIPKDGDSSANTYLIQPVLPLSKSNVLRPGLPIIETPGPNRETGIGDLVLLDIWIFQAKNGSWGIGPIASLPTASDDALGSGQYELGPVAMYMYKGVPKNLFGILVHNLTSVGGDSGRADVNKFFFQPIWVAHFGWGYMGWTDQTATIDWENDNALSFPVGFRFGKVFAGSKKTLMNLAAGFYYTFNEGRDDEYGLKITGTFIKPGWLNH
jgi:hypothetical protein